MKNKKEIIKNKLNKKKIVFFARKFVGGEFLNFLNLNQPETVSICVRYNGELHHSFQIEKCQENHEKLSKQ